MYVRSIGLNPQLAKLLFALGKQDASNEILPIQCLHAI